MSISPPGMRMGAGDQVSEISFTGPRFPIPNPCLGVQHDTAE